MTQEQKPSVTIVTPIYNDWESFKLILQDINNKLEGLQLGTVNILAVDDGSYDKHDLENSYIKQFDHIDSVAILHLACNLGSQRAIAIGLAHVANNMQTDLVIVMDADGEDKPEDIVRLLAEYKKSPDNIIVAHRSKRSESIPFRIFYWIYKLLFRCLTGKQISFGNFCLIPHELLRKLVYRSELWNNLPASVIRSGIPFRELSTSRGKRLTGSSKMRITSLIIHGLSTIAVYSDVSLVRILLACLLLSSSTLAGIAVVAGIRFGTDLAIPGWASDVAGSLLILLVQSAMISIVVIFLLLNNKSQQLVIPNRHYVDYIASKESLT